MYILPGGTNVLTVAASPATPNKKGPAMPHSPAHNLPPSQFGKWKKCVNILYITPETSLAVKICKFELALFAQSNASSMQIMRVPTYIIWIAE